MSTTAADVVREFQGTWPAWLPQALPGGATEPVRPHPLADEVAALLAGRSAALPYFPTSGEVTWAALAPGPRELLTSLSDLRAWVLPSLAREHPQGLVVTRAQAGSLGARLLSLSPAGYARWVSSDTREVVARIAARLRRARELEAAAPPHPDDLAPALLEVRQRLAAALAAGDRIAAEEVLYLLDRLQLDSAQNALLTRIRVWDHFGEAGAIVELPELPRLLRLRLPTSALAAVARAFHRHHLAGHEEDGRLSDALATYEAAVAPALAGIHSSLRAEYGLEVRRLVGYQAATQGDVASLRALAEAYPDDPVLGSLLPPGPVEPVPPPSAPSEEEFFTAWRLQDWAEMQRIGLSLLPTHAHLVPVLERSLAVSPNAELWHALQASTSPPATEPPCPLTWPDWFASLATAEERALELFLEAEEQAGSRREVRDDLDAVCERLYEVLTAPPGTYSPARTRLLVSGLTDFIGEVVGSPEFPSAGEAELYRLLAQCWTEQKSGSAYPPDGQLLLELADAALQFTPTAEGVLVDLVERWWNSRPARGLLPFMLAGVEIFQRLGVGGHAERLWVLAGEFVRSRGQMLTPGERALWRRVGRDIGYDDQTLDEYVPLSPVPGEVDEDPLRLANLSKIAIVSTRQEQAERAAELLRERTDADVVVVTATTSGHETRSAAEADVIAYVWAASTHAVYRAFDRVDRRKLAYVQGTGVGSIVLAVERWVHENALTASGDLAS